MVSLYTRVQIIKDSRPVDLTCIPQMSGHRKHEILVDETLISPPNCSDRYPASTKGVAGQLRLKSGPL